MISGVIDELLRLADANGCKLDPDFKQRTMDDMTKPDRPEGIMWQDYLARRPMEFETYLGSPIKLARETRVPVPRIETLYAVLHHLNAVNRSKPKPSEVLPSNTMPPSSPVSTPQPRAQSQAAHRPMPSGMPNGNGMGPRQPRLVKLWTSCPAAASPTNERWAAKRLPSSPAICQWRVKGSLSPGLDGRQ